MQLTRVVTRWAGAIGLAAACACADSAIVEFPCDGARFEIDGHPYCVYRPSQRGPGTTCPTPAPAHIEIDDGSLVCSDRDLSPCELPSDICRVLDGCCTEPDASMPMRDAAIDPGNTDAGSTDGGIEPPIDAASTDDAGSTEADAAPPVPDASSCETVVSIGGPTRIADTEILGGSCHSREEQDSHRSMEPSFAASSDVRRGTCLVHALIRVDLADIPPEADITRAVLRLYLEEECSTVDASSPCGSYDGMWSLPLANLVAPWIPEQTDWWERSDGVAWSEGGATGERGTEIGHPLRPSEGVERFVELSVLAQVRAMHRDPETNHGWLMRSSRLAGVRRARFASTESPEETRRPTLEITYTRPCAGP